jgi:hypothetical protein
MTELYRLYGKDRRGFLGMEDKMKRLMAIVLTLIMCTAMIAGCGSDSSGEKNDTGSKSASTNEAASAGVLKVIDVDLSDEQYVRILYNAFLGRECDPEGLSYWLNRLATGSSRLDVYHGFSRSNEFAALCTNAGFNPY